VAAQPRAGAAGDERPCHVGAERDQHEQSAQECALERNVAARRRDELRDEGEKEQRRLGIQDVDDDAVAKDAQQ
jgi:hypothetical protein